MKKLLLLLTVFIFCGCSPQQRIARIAEKYNLTQHEVVVFRDTVIIEPQTYMFQAEIDSSGYFSQEINGVELTGNVTKNIVTVKVVTDFDTVYIEKPINIETIKIKKVEKRGGFWEKFSSFFSLAVFLIFAGAIIFKILFGGDE